MTKNNNLYIISGPSGSGKTTIMRKVMQNEIVSFTTRPKREKEIEGVDYNFITEETYEIFEELGRLVESTYYGGNYYGLTIEEIESRLKTRDAFVVLDFHGMIQLKEIYPYCTTIFLMTNKQDAMKFMLNRGDSLESIFKRMKTFDEEQGVAIHYDYVVKNEIGKMDKTVNIIKAIVGTG